MGIINLPVISVKWNYSKLPQCPGLVPSHVSYEFMIIKHIFFIEINNKIGRSRGAIALTHLIQS